MKSADHQAGFSLLEVLLALSLFAFVCLSFVDIELKSLQTESQSLQVETAERQLNNFSALVEASQFDFSAWRQETKQILPKAKADIQIDGNSYVVNLTWKSSERVWKCKSQYEKGCSCLSITVKK